LENRANKNPDVDDDADMIDSKVVLQPNAFELTTAYRQMALTIRRLNGYYHPGFAVAWYRWFVGVPEVRSLAIYQFLCFRLSIAWDCSASIRYRADDYLHKPMKSSILIAFCWSPGAS
jgi:hypothetical protein